MAKEYDYRRKSSSDDYSSDINAMWLMLGAILVIFMQTGFAMLEVGTVSYKNTKNILIKNIFDSSLGCIAFWWLGYGFAYGKDYQGFIGTDSLAFTGDSWNDGYLYAHWIFNWAFASTAATIVSGSVAERVTFLGYLLYAVVITAFIYPVVVHWVWSEDGWASPHNEEPLFGCGVIDWAGAGVVHMTGGLCAVLGAYFVGARLNRFNIDGTWNEFPEQNPIQQTLGSLFLWFSWFGFNGVASMQLTGHGGIAARAMVMTAISAASSAIATVIIGQLHLKIIDQRLANHGLLCGCVAITAGCSTVTAEGAFIIGVLAAPVYYGSQQLLLKIKIDDVVNAISVHFACGIYGLFMAGLLADPDNYQIAYSTSSSIAADCCGVCYGGSGKSLGANMTLLLANLAWTGGTSAFLFAMTKWTVGLRVTREIEEAGMDASKHGGIGIPEGFHPTFSHVEKECVNSKNWPENSILGND